MLNIGLPDFSCLKIFTFQCFKSVTPFVVQERYPPTTAVDLQTPTLVLQLTASR